ncbi:MAG: energy transducer TonB [Verrucomicrobiaceae bacterium]|nr:energy transducer TonB [Verrucomicrobiaceae bacterium]
MAVVRIPNPKLPWSSSYNEDSRFRKILITLLALYILVALVVTWLRLPPVVHPEPKDLPPQLAQVVLQKIELPKPAELPKVPPKPVEKKPLAEAPKPKPIVPPSKTPVPPSRTAPVTGRTGGKEAPVELMQQARATASKSGVLQFKDDLAEMRESVDVSKVTRSNLTRGTSTAEKTERSIIAGKATGGSGGINTAALSRDTGGIALSGRETTRIDSPGGLGGLSTEAGGRGRGEGTGTGSGTGVGKGSGKKGDLVSGSEGGGGRSDEAIRRVMDQQKGGIFAIYNRALRQDSTLQGKFVFEMVIEPSGEISEVKMVSSELRDTDLVSKILARIRLINFGAANAQRTRVNYSLDFLPNA